MVLRVQEDGRARDIPIKAGRSSTSRRASRTRRSACPIRSDWSWKPSACRTNSTVCCGTASAATPSCTRSSSLLRDIENDFPAVFEHFYRLDRAPHLQGLRAPQPRAGEVPPVAITPAPVSGQRSCDAAPGREYELPASMRYSARSRPTRDSMRSRRPRSAMFSARSASTSTSCRAFSSRIASTSSDSKPWMLTVLMPFSSSLIQSGKPARLPGR